MDLRLICPYCKHVQPEGERGDDPSETYMYQCEACKKNFVYLPTERFAYWSAQARCLNGGRHRWHVMHLHKDAMFHRRCMDCDAIGKFKEWQIKAHIKKMQEKYYRRTGEQL